MSNEELAIKIKSGDNGYMPQLWEQVRRFIALKAIRLWNSLENKRGLEIDDLIQQGYFAVLSAVKYYDPEKDFKFTTYLNNTLKTAYRDIFKINPVNISLSFNEPMGEDDSMTLLDVISDEVADETGDIDESIYNRDLRNALDKALTVATNEQRRSIELYFYFGYSQAEIAGHEGKTKNNISSRIHEGLCLIYQSRYKNMLRKYLPDGKPDEYRGTGFSAWKYAGSVEEKFIIKQEGQTWTGKNY